jgi:hypothetical protein
MPLALSIIFICLSFYANEHCEMKNIFLALTMIAVDRRIKPKSIKLVFATSPAVLMSKSKDWLAWNQHKVSLFTHVLLFQ